MNASAFAWQPIATAPKDGRLVDLFVSGPRNDGARQTDCWFNGYEWRKDYGRDGEYGVEVMIGDVPTHWMPLPEDPDTKE